MEIILAIFGIIVFLFFFWSVLSDASYALGEFFSVASTRSRIKSRKRLNKELMRIVNDKKSYRFSTDDAREILEESLDAEDDEDEPIELVNPISRVKPSRRTRTFRK